MKTAELIIVNNNIKFLQLGALAYFNIIYIAYILCIHWKNDIIAMNNFKVLFRLKKNI